MNTSDSKSAYFDISKSLSIPARCPLLGRCERRAHTIALANEWPLDDADQRVGLHHPIVKSLGESAYIIGGNDNFVFGGNVQRSICLRVLRRSLVSLESPR